MKSRRIFAAVMASVCAVSATAVAASATEETAVIGTVKGNGAVTDGNVMLKDTLKGIDATAVAKVVVTLTKKDGGATVNGAIGMNVAGKWTSWSKESAKDKLEWSVDVEGVDAESLQVQIHYMDGLEWSDTDEAWKGEATVTVESVKYLDKDGKELKAPADPDTPAGDKDDNKDDNKPGATDKTDDNKPGATDKTDDNKPGASDKETITNDVVVDKVLKGADLTKAIFGDSKKEWKDVESVTFESDDPFAVVFNVKAGKIKDDAKATKFIKGVTELTKDEDLPAKAFATKWTLSADEVAAMLEADAKADSLQLISKDGKKITVKATVTTKAASKPDDNKNTGIALVVAPVVLAGAAVAVAAISKKRK